ncbi:hypothetical protein A2U01_0088477, partial [Trifolium medium]|nr:hypothetical protein [Trifolium medium]
KVMVGPINRGQISPSEQSLAQRTYLDSKPKLAGWSEEPSRMVLAQRGTLLQVSYEAY